MGLDSACLCVSVLALLSCGSAGVPSKALKRDAPSATASRAPVDVEGTWYYQTTSENCGANAKGRVTLSWDTEQSLFVERGSVRWQESGTVIEWWGTARYDAKRNSLRGEYYNTLGDKVTGLWRLEKGRMLLDWSQSNGCRGHGIATRTPQKIAAPGLSTLASGSFWAGHYICSQGFSSMTLAVAKSQTGQLRATVWFHHIPKNVSGKYTCEVSQTANGTIVLTPLEWITQPENYRMVSMRGKLADNGRSFAGTMDASTCKDFWLTRSK